MKKIISLLIIGCLLCTLVSCKAKSLNENKFTKYAMDISSGKTLGKIIDLRSIDDYANYHIYSSFNYDLNTKDIKEINTWLNTYLREGRKVLLIDDGNGAAAGASKLLTNYKIYYYENGYDTLRESSYFEERIIEVSGLDDCGC